MAECDVLSEAVTAEEERGSPRTQRTRWIAVNLLVGLLLCVLWLAGQTALYGSAYADRILPGAQIAGVNVDGLTHHEAVAAVGAVVDSRLDRTIRLVYLDRVWEVTPRQLGATSDTEAMVGEAMAASRAVGWQDLFAMRWMGKGLGLIRPVTVTHNEPAARAVVDQIAAQVDVPARDASIDYSSGWIQIIPEQPGRAVAVQATMTELLARLADGQDVVTVQALELQPAVTRAAFHKVLLLRQREHRLYLYQGGVPTHSWLVATGTGDYPTPTGQYRVTQKRYMPTWINPAPDGWGQDLPASIPPGPGNPLGIRALNWSGGGGIRFHGTSEIGSLGNNASHGCVRLSNRDVVQLYDLVDVGTTIVSLR
jgi:lipoprotein-anchoring transpeptidase ErfK/SrfK